MEWTHGNTTNLVYLSLIHIQMCIRDRCYAYVPGQNNKADYELQAYGKVKVWETDDEMMKSEQAKVPNPGDKEFLVAPGTTLLLLADHLWTVDYQ